MAGPYRSEHQRHGGLWSGNAFTRALIAVIKMMKRTGHVVGLMESNEPDEILRNYGLLIDSVLLLQEKIKNLNT